MLHKLSFLGTLLGLLSVTAAKTLFIATDYSAQSGTQVHSGQTTVGLFDNNDYLTYASANFGPSGTTKGIRINYAKANWSGKIEVRLGVGTTGRLIGEFRPAKTGGWSNYITSYFDIDEDVKGTQDITFVGKDSSGVLNLAWFELSDFSERSDLYARISAREYSDQSGVQFEKSKSEDGSFTLGSYHNGDYVSFANVNFGPSGTTDGIRIRYAKASNGGSVEVRQGGADGKLLTEFSPANSGGWGNWVEGYIGLDGVDGIHELTFVAKGISGVLNLDWFELSDRSKTFPSVLANAFSNQSGVRTDMYAITYFDNGDFVTYSNINFGPSGTTKSMNLEYSKGNNKGKLELRLDSPDGAVIATYHPKKTGGWQDYINVDIPLDLVDGIHDLVFVAGDSSGVMNWKSFELSPKKLSV